VKRRRTKAKQRQRPARWLLYGFVVILLMSLVPVALFRFVDPPITSFMLQRRFQARQQGRADFMLRQQWVDLDRLPPHVGMAVMSSEDQRFFEHGGFDVQAIKQAVGEHLQGEPLRGASTLTQQVAKNLFLWEGRSFFRKLLEVYFTFWLEALWPKRRILEVYLNIAELGDGVFGVGAAARSYFDRPARRLTAEQAALLAALLPSPLNRDARRPSAHVRRKQGWILDQMARMPRLPLPK
jgi:monofunctional biosynthetic peptidoglycan transglycosylase